MTDKNRNLVADFEKWMKTDGHELDRAIALLKVCRGYLENHYRRSVYGEYQKGILDYIDEFLQEFK